MTLSSTSRFEQQDHRRHERRQDHEGEEQIDPHRDDADRVGHVTLQLPPHEGLVDLVQSQEDRERCDQSILRTAAQVQTGVHADGGDDEAADEVSLR